ncbi:L-threonylcarbamoyladenylate synthase [Algicella marina]|uniref:Threonylcarbamoyl-AMP synthase n=1 Tax=Algicella marina TaxID=2683284 RepID=A0A6P1SWA6_9RHOB|nr:L-threonylcarbamoyladenylate synthase [Algicella marina]QHQ33771.1 threonylcarbamoyl-AMP synthase [Algicella marina]
MTASEKNTFRLSATDRGIRAASSLLAQGGLVAFPTETVYGLGCDARNDRAVAGVYAAKGRPSFNPLIIHVPDTASAEAFADFTPRALDLAQAFWPGPLTLILPRKPESSISPLASGGLPTVAIRIPAHPLARKLLAAFGGPVAAPSANPSGRISPSNADHVMEGLAGRIDAVLDGGPCAVGLESTILDLTNETPILARPGGIPVEALEKALGTPLAAHGTSTGITAPGQLSSHYAPGAALHWPQSPVHPADALWLAFGPLGTRRGLTLSHSGDLAEAAANLFGHMHALDKLAAEQGQTSILLDKIPETGLGLAINDRLRRASAPRDDA